MTELCVIWDFNGTILDDVQTGINSINRLLSRRGLPTIKSVEEYHRHFRFPIIDYYAGLGFDFQKEPFSKVAPEWVAEYDRLVPQAGLCPGVRRAVELIAKSREKAGARAAIKQVILSATEQNMLLRQISDLGLDGVFDEALGMDNIEAHSKLPAARRFRDRHPDARLVMIGDTTHDYEVASAIGAECILVASGHQSRETLLSCGVPVCDNAIEAARLIVGNKG